jgi:hypothetical protein
MYTWDRDAGRFNFSLLTFYLILDLPVEPAKQVREQDDKDDGNKIDVQHKSKGEFDYGEIQREGGNSNGDRLEENGFYRTLRQHNAKDMTDGTAHNRTENDCENEYPWISLSEWHVLL